MDHHNRELLDTIKQLKAMIVQLEAENQLLKEAQTPDGNGMNNQFEWTLENPYFMSLLPSAMAWDPQDG